MAFYLVPIGAVMGFGFFCAFMYEKRFSMQVFLIAVAVGMAVIVWVGLFPTFGLALSALCLIGMVFSEGGSIE
jgi:uncharacterized protein (DUF2062 family)